MMNDDKAVSSKHPTWADTNDTEQSRHWSDKLESPPQQLKEDVAKPFKIPDLLQAIDNALQVAAPCGEIFDA